MKRSTTQHTKGKTPRLRTSLAATALTVPLWAAGPALLITAASAVAQNTNSTIQGQVLDPSGALVSGAHVVIVNTKTGVTAFDGSSDSAGAFVAPQILPGTYKVTVTAQGLKESVTDNVIATVAQIASLNISMQVGEVTDVVTVQARGEQLDRSTSDISTLITPTEVQNLPLNQRQTENLIALVPGVAHGGAADSPSTSQLSINGGRTLDTEVLLNGVSTIVASTGSPATLPSPDGVDQFRVLATNAPAEYGRTSGAVISVNTISGTNKLHGNLYYLMRNEDFDANSFFNNLKGLPRGRDRFFQLGGSLGGPVWIPKVYDGHNRTFFFVNYDWTIQPNSSSISETVPTAAQRTGDLSNALQATSASGAPAPVIVYQPTGRTSPAISGNRITNIDPAAAKILALLPLPNFTGTYDRANNRYTGNWISQQNTTGHVLRLVARVDEQLTQKDRLSFNVYRYTTSTPNPITYGVPLLNTTWDCTCNNAWLPSIDYTRVWTPTLVLDLNMGFFRNAVYRNPPGLDPNASQTLGIASLPLQQTPELTSPGFSNIGPDTNTNQINITNTFTPFGTVTKTVGPHTFRFGASLRKNQFNSYNPASSPEGTLNFDGSITNHGNSGNATTGLADFLLGQIKTGSYEQPMPPTGRRNYNLGIFFQDDWKVTPKLAINAGLRWEYESPVVIANNIYSRFSPDTGQLLVAGQNASRSLNITEPKADFSPRVGLAYSINQKTIFRAAFGTFYGTIFQNLGGQIAFPGYDNNITYNNLGTAVAQPFTLSQGFPLSAPPNLQNPGASPALVNATPSNPYGISGVEFNKLNPMPLVQQWNAGFERALPLALRLEVNYVGNHALHLPYLIPANVVPLSQVDAVTQANTTLASQQVKPFPNLASWSAIDHVGSSEYDSLQVSVQRQFNTRLAVFANYTFSKNLDDGSTIYNFSAPNGTSNAQYTAISSYRERDWAVSAIDAKHTANIALVYTTPGPWWLRDWHISPVFEGHTGLPVNITQSNEISNVSQQRPNGDSSHLKLSNATLNGAALQYLDSPVIDANFPLTPSGPVYSTINGVRTRIVSTGFGNVPRNSLRQPGEVDFDASLAKDFPVFRELKFQLRLDAFNVINHTNFTAPNTSLSVSTVTNSTVANFANSSSFGQITGTQPSRRLQLSARFQF
jgi:hypothetical protein